MILKNTNYYSQFIVEKKKQHEQHERKLNLKNF